MRYYKTDEDGKMKEIFDMETAIRHVQDSYKELKEENEYLHEQLRLLKEEYSKDEEIKKYKEAAERARKEADNGFPVPEHINKKIEKWKEKHIREKHWDPINKMPMSAGAAGGRFIYMFQPTGIGTLITCKCCCGEEITEMDG